MAYTDLTATLTHLGHKSLPKVVSASSQHVYYAALYYSVEGVRERMSEMPNRIQFTNKLNFSFCC